MLSDFAVLLVETRPDHEGFPVGLTPFLCRKFCLRLLKANSIKQNGPAFLGRSMTTLGEVRISGSRFSGVAIITKGSDYELISHFSSPSKTAITLSVHNE